MSSIIFPRNVCQLVVSLPAFAFVKHRGDFFLAVVADYDVFSNFLSLVHFIFPCLPLLSCLLAYALHYQLSSFCPLTVGGGEIERWSWHFDGLRGSEIGDSRPE